jgi:outer membrane protein
MLWFALALSSVTALASPRAFTLNDLFRETVETSDAVRVKAEERIQAEETKTKSGSAFLPQVSGVASYLRNDAPPPTAESARIFPQDQKTARIVAQQYLFQGGSEYAYYSRTKLLIESKEAELAHSRQRYYLDLANAYYDLLLRRANLEHAKAELQLYDEQIEELGSRVRIGRSRSTDLLSARAARASSESRLRAAESELAFSRLALGNLARLAEFEVREDETSTKALDPLDAYLKASEQRPDLVAIRKRRDATAKDLTYYRGFHFPSLGLGANYYLHREGANANSKWDATLTLTVPLFAGGSTQSDVRLAASSLRASEVQAGELERRVETEIRQLHQNLIAAAAEMKALSSAVELSGRAYQQTKKDYRFGLTTHLDLLESLRTHTEAKKSFDQARYRHAVERIQLEIGAGRIPTI